MVLGLIKNLKQGHQIQHVTGILMGSNTKEIKEFRHDQLEQHGIGKDRDEHYWNSVIRNALLHNLLRKDIEQYGLLKLTEKGSAFIDKPKKTEISINHNYVEQADAEVVTANKGAALDQTLFKMLDDLRAEVAKSQNLPRYVVFQEFSLQEMATNYPTTMDELANISGVGRGKAEKFGQAFIDMISDYVEENGIEKPDDFVIKSVIKKSTHKVEIIKSIDQKLALEEIAENLHIKFGELVVEMETIVNSGTKVDIDYYLEDNYDEDLIDDMMDYLQNAENDDINEVLVEFEEDELEPEDVQLMRIKFLSDHAN